MKRKKSKPQYVTDHDDVEIDRTHLLTDDTPFAIKEAYVRLRTNLMFCLKADGENPCKVFAVTSANPSEGKSLTSANIAISCAMLGKKTILIDADMRRPMQHKLWEIKNTDGLCDYIAKIRPLKTSKVEKLPLVIVCSGTIPPNPSEMIASDRMRLLVEKCAEYYDYVIIDTPPINTVADAQIITKLVDGMVVVARSGVTTVDELAYAIDTVKNAGGNLCGVLLNDMNMKSAKYSYRYRYGNKYDYKYGYKYAYKTDYSTK